ncbi:substrate-binding domain-containing protein [Kitasatospora sp. NPDC086791]|uniref:substrate-binding domain-containing protein n=1 Tax=Kitasatospora sp. NPDC086791 TaxID=3155178 RepID=UPI003418E6AF
MLAAAGDTTSPRLYSWDARGAGSITSKTGASAILRPTNTREALNTLLYTTSGTLDFVRLSRPPQSGDPASIDFLPVAKDVVSWAAPAGGNAPVSLTSAELKSIYACDLTDWRQIDPNLPDAPIKPVVPGAFFSDPNTCRTTYTSDEMTALATAATGSTGGSASTFYAGPCVTPGVADDQGSEAILHDPNAIVPYSVGRWAGQVTGGQRKPGDDPGVLVPHGVDRVAPSSTASSVRPSRRAGTAGPSSSGCGTPTGRAPTRTARRLRKVFGRNGWACTSPVATADLLSHGFLRLPVFACGSSMHA